MSLEPAMVAALFVERGPDLADALRDALELLREAKIVCSGTQDLSLTAERLLHKLTEAGI